MSRYTLEMTYETDADQEGIDGMELAKAVSNVLLKREPEGAEITFTSVGIFPKRAWIDSRPMPDPNLYHPDMDRDYTPMPPKAESWLKRIAYELLRK